MKATTPMASTTLDGDLATISVSGYISTDAADPFADAFGEAQSEGPGQGHAHRASLKALPAGV